MEVLSTGNTNASAKVQKRQGYFVTFWTHDYPRELPDKAKYLCTCEDSTKKGQYHGHAFIFFHNPCAMSRVKKLFGKECHVKKPRKISDCIGYVLRTEGTRKHDFQEFGEKPMDHGGLRVKDLKECKDPDSLPWMMYNTWKKIHEETHAIKITDWYKPEVKVTYVYGPSGTNKTRKIFEDIIEKYGENKLVDEVKHVNDFWNGVSGETDVAIYDDFRDSHMKASEFINFIDYYTHNLNIKGGNKRNNYKHIYISSVLDPHEIYRNCGDEPMKQWLRRMEIIPTALDL